MIIASISVGHEEQLEVFTSFFISVDLTFFFGGGGKDCPVHGRGTASTYVVLRRFLTMVEAKAKSLDLTQEPTLIKRACKHYYAVHIGGIYILRNCSDAIPRVRSKTLDPTQQPTF